MLASRLARSGLSRAKLQAELDRAKTQLDQRMAQHERARQKLLADHRGPIAEAQQALAEIDAEIEAAAELVRNKVVPNV